MTLKILSFTSLYPNGEQIRHGIFVENRLRQLKQSHDVEIRVCAPVPWFPFKSKLFGQYASFAKVAKHETRHGIQVDHPRYLVIPKLGMNLAPILMFLCLLPTIRRYIRSGYDFDVCDAHFFYPDGVVAVMLASLFNKPVTVTARGSDINLYTQFWLPRRFIRWAAQRCSAVITVCKDLAEGVRALDIGHQRIEVMRNGVDCDVFKPAAREIVRDKYDITGFTILSVGNLIELKGHHLIIKALSDMPDTTLLIVGDGPMSGELRSLASEYGVENRVHFAGTIPQAELANFYSAADCLVLASSREGWANVLLESMACGTPVVATQVGGTVEIVTNREAGVLVKERSVSGILEGIKQLRINLPDRQQTLEYAKGFSWHETSKMQYTLFTALAARGDAR